MKSFPAGTIVTVSIPFIDLNGDPVVPTAATYQILDENEAVLATGTVSDLSGTDAEITVPANLNTVNVASGIRVVMMTMTAPSGQIDQTVYYTLAASSPSLIVFHNSFQSYARALLVATGLLNLNGWAGANDETRRQALAEAYRRITRFEFTIDPLQVPDFQSFVNWGNGHTIRVNQWSLMTSSIWTSYPAIFKDAIYRAQVIEADHILMSDPIAEKRRQGILSETVGEASRMYRSGKPLEIGISRETALQLTGFIVYNKTIARE